MKIIRIILVMFLIAVTANFVAANNCTMNSYLKVRSEMSHRLEPLLTVNMDVRNICVGELDKYGSCCEPSSLHGHAATIENNLLTSALNLADFYPKLAGLSNKILSLIKNLSLAEPPNWSQQFKDNVEWARLFLDDVANLKKFDQFKTFGTEPKASTYKVNAQKCWSNMIQYRKASLCFTCSGRSQVFFQGEKGLAEEKYCYQSLVNNNCLDWLKVTAEWLEMIHWLNSKKIEFRRHDLDLAFHSAMHEDQIEVFYQNLVSGGFESKLQGLTSTMLNDQDLAIKLCNKYFNLAHLPFIHTMTYAFFKVPNPVTYYGFTEAINQSKPGVISAGLPALEQKIAAKLAVANSSRLLELSRNLIWLTDGSDVNFLKTAISTETTTKIADPFASNQPMVLDRQFP